MTLKFLSSFLYDLRLRDTGFHLDRSVHGKIGKCVSIEAISEPYRPVRQNKMESIILDSS